MAFVTIEDLYGSVEIIVFPKMLEQCRNLIYDGSVISVNGSLSIEEEKDPKVIANSVEPPPSESSVSQPSQNTTGKKKRPVLYLRFESKNDKRIPLVKRVTDIFDGTIPLCFYYIDSGEYEMQPGECFVEVNKTELSELKRILGSENVVFSG